MKKLILQNWSLMRLLRLLIAIIAGIQAYQQHDITLGILAGFLLFTALANIGCCGANGCSVRYRPTNPKKGK